MTLTLLLDCPEEEGLIFLQLVNLQMQKKNDPLPLQEPINPFGFRSFKLSTGASGAGGSFFFLHLQINQFLQAELPILEATYRYTPMRA